MFPSLIKEMRRIVLRLNRSEHFQLCFHFNGDLSKTCTMSVAHTLTPLLSLVSPVLQLGVRDHLRGWDHNASDRCLRPYSVAHSVDDDVSAVCWCVPASWETEPSRVADGGCTDATNAKCSDQPAVVVESSAEQSRAAQGRAVPCCGEWSSAASAEWTSDGRKSE